MSGDLRARVEEWLKNLGCTPTTIQDPQTVWHIEFDYPVNRGHRMHVAMPKGPAESILIASVVTLSPEHIGAFDEYADDEKAEFLFGLRQALNQPNVDFQLHGVEEPLKCPESFQLSSLRFPDGLSMDSFARSVGAVYKTELAGIWYVQETLGGQGLGPSGRFDFKRLGL